MNYDNIVEGIFIERLNRFIARVLIEGEETLVHVKNTGRCKELLIKGVKVFLERSSNPNRKTKYSLISVYKGKQLINMDSNIPNNVVYEAIRENKVLELKDVDLLKKEITYKNSRFDLYYEKDQKRGFIEVKGVTLEENGIACFPDAPTSRGAKHINELIDSVKHGYESYIFFLIQMDHINRFTPNYKTDIVFSSALRQAEEEGVNILCYNSFVKPTEIKLNQSVELFF